MFDSKEPLGAAERGLVRKETDPQATPERETSSSRHTIIPSDLQITGDLVSTGDIHVEGVIHGNITCRTLTLTGQPVIQGSVQVEMVRVSGTFDGKLQSKKVTLTKAAKMTGEIYYEILEIEAGASFQGTLSRVEGT